MAESVDVLICGGGPVGLLTALGLARMGISTVVIEKSYKDKQAMYGRASTLYPRTLEMLDQLDVLEPVAQIGYISRSYTNFRGGKRAVSGGYQMLLSQMHDTYVDYVINIRQKYSEETFREAYEAKGGHMYEGTELVDLVREEGAPDGYELTAVVKDVASGEQRQIKCKYIVGADGTRSAVRKLANIPFTGDNTGLKWFRIDAVVKTDMPDPRVGLASVESATHGTALWMALDHGRTRIGFALPRHLSEKYEGNITEEEAKEEARKAVQPFSLDFEQVDWWTLYSISHRVADNFRTQKRILLAGDACHCHSSGTAQGMNTGVHDAVNLAWKLGGVLRGWYDESVLDTYEQERRPEAQRVIEMDKTISSLITGQIPPGLGKPGAHPFEVLYQFTASTMQFTLGLGVHYKPNILNHPASVGLVTPGWRGPDVPLQRPGSRMSVRLFQITKNVGKFYILVFSGNPASTRDKLVQFRRYLDTEDSFTRSLAAVSNFLTIIPGYASQADEYLGVDRFGEAFYDADQTASIKYGFSPAEGGIAVLRPDGILGTAVQLDQGAEIGRYFRQFVKDGVQSPQSTSAALVENGARKEIEFDTETTAPVVVAEKAAPAA